MIDPSAAATRVRWAEPGDAGAVADRIAAELARPAPRRIALPGGSTPAKVFAALAARGLDWTGTTLCLTDDRQVPDDHPASNWAKLIGALGGSGAAFERLAAGAAVAPFDLVWLGMGEDGHVASLFPQMVCDEGPDGAEPRVVAALPVPLPPEAPFPRLSLNFASLLAAREVILVVTGAAKRALIERVLTGTDAAARALPVARLLTGDGPPVTLYWSA